MPDVCCWLWTKIDPISTMPNGVNHKYFLWGFIYFRVYDTKENCACLVGKVDENTYREWSYHFADAIPYLKCDVVSTTGYPGIVKFNLDSTIHLSFNFQIGSCVPDHP